MGKLPINILNNSKISLKAKGLYCFLCTKSNGWATSAETIKQNMKEGLYSIKAALKELENAGFLIRKPIKTKEGRWDKTIYILKDKGE